jgi:Ca2+-binding RTX toxin-like protein
MSNGTVEGTSGGDLIDANYAGDPDGDKVDNNDAPDGSNNDAIAAGEGNDTVLAGAGNDVVYGDSIALDPPDHASVSNGATTNLTVINSADGPIELWWIDGSGTPQFYGTIQPGGAYLQPTYEDHNWVLRDQDGNYLELIEGAPNQTVNYGADGLDDSLAGGDGDDTVYGQFGDDTIDGGLGSDTLYGGTGNDDIFGGAGDDTIVADDFSATGPNLIVNGSFEDTTGMTQTWFGVSGSGGTAPGWTDANGSSVEFHADGRGGLTATDGAYWLDLEADPGQNSSISQTIAGAQDGEVYILTFDAGDLSDANDGTALDNQLQVIWNGEVIATIDPSDGSWTSYEFHVIGGSGDGSNTLTFAGTGNADGIGASLDNVQMYAAAEAAGGTDNLFGGDGNDDLIGGAGNDTLDGGGGNDMIVAGSGNDIVVGGDGNDTIFGGAGDDTLNGGLGADTLYGGDGSDTFIYTQGEGTDTIFGGEGGQDRDTLQLAETPIVGTGATISYTSAETGSFSFSSGSGTFAEIEVVRGSESGDAFLGNAATTGIEAYGEGGFDFMQGGSGNDTLYGGTGGDTLQGGGGADTLYGENDNDRLEGGLGNDTLFGGLGNDILVGGDNDDQLFGGDGRDTLQGGIGNDSLDGGLGDDSLVGDDGDDVLVGGDGDDTLNGMTGNDILFGGLGNDTLWGGSGNDTIDAGDGNDSINAGFGDDTVFGGAGVDTILGGDGNDTVDAGDGNDSVTVGTGNDTVFGGAGDDSLGGGDGNDTLDGGDGNDTLAGGNGDDRLTGGSGNDMFDFVRNGGADVVTDFSLADTDADGRYDDQLDVSELRDLDGNPVNAWDVTVSDDGLGNALLTFPEGETILLMGVTPAQMQTASQKFAAGIPCFTTGTRIRTPGGEVPIEVLRPGDKVLTRDNGPQPLVWVGIRRLDATDLAARPDLRPVVFAPGAMGQDRRLLVSPQHGMLLASGPQEALVRAIHLARLPGGKVRVAKGVRSVTYVHLMFERHQVIWGNDLPSESFYPGPWGLSALDPSALREIARLFPDAVKQGPASGYGAPARPFLSFAELQRDARNRTPRQGLPPGCHHMPLPHIRQRHSPIGCIDREFRSRSSQG